MRSAAAQEGLCAFRSPSNKAFGCLEQGESNPICRWKPKTEIFKCRERQKLFGESYSWLQQDRKAATSAKFTCNRRSICTAAYRAQIKRSRSHHSATEGNRTPESALSPSTIR